METLQIVREFIVEHKFFAMLIFAGLVFLLNWLWNLFCNSQRDVQKVHGTARFAQSDEVYKAKLVHDGKTGMTIGSYGEGFLDSRSHATVVAPTGSGKGVGIIIPTLLNYRGSIIVNDPKSENQAVTARRREELGQDVISLDPWGMGSRRTSQINPLEYIELNSPKVISQASVLAGSLCGNIPKDGDNAYFYLAAKAFVRFCILYALAKDSGQKEKPNLERVFRLIFCSREEVIEMLETARGFNFANGKIALIAQSLQKTAIDGKGEFSKAFQSVLSNAEVYFDFMLDDEVSYFFEKNSYDYLELENNFGSTVYIIVSPEKEDTATAVLRIIYSMFFQLQYTKKEDKAKIPLLLIADEFAQLKHFPTIKCAMSIIRGFGMRIMIVMQNVDQLREYYDKGANEFLANSTNIYFGASSSEAKEISERMGNKTVTQKTTSADGKVSTSEAAQALMTPDEIAALSENKALVFIRGMRPLKINRIEYYTDSHFKGMFDPRPSWLL